MLVGEIRCALMPVLLQMCVAAKTQTLNEEERREEDEEVKKLRGKDRKWNTGWRKMWNSWKLSVLSVCECNLPPLLSSLPLFPFIFWFKWSSWFCLHPAFLILTLLRHLYTSQLLRPCLYHLFFPFKPFISFNSFEVSHHLSVSIYNRHMSFWRPQQINE